MTTSMLIERRTDKRPHPLTGKYLTFLLDGEEYGLPVLQVREIVKMAPITRVPQVAPHVKGVVNLRGRVVPVIDLRVKLGFEPTDYTDRTCIIVVDVRTESGSGPTGVMGLIVDSVSEVSNIQSGELQDPPGVGGEDASWVKAVAQVKNSVRMLIDLDRLLGDDLKGVR